MDADERMYPVLTLPARTTISDYQRSIHENNVLHGWHGTARTFGDEMALLHSEISEAFEAYRSGGLEDQSLQLLPGERGIVKPEGVGSELADVFIRLLDCARRYEIDLDYEVQRKMRYNETRPWRHGGKAL